MRFHPLSASRSGPPALRTSSSSDEKNRIRVPPVRVGVATPSVEAEVVDAGDDGAVIAFLLLMAVMALTAGGIIEWMKRLK